MTSADSFLLKALEKRKSENALRSLSDKDDLIDFCSNDYLGFARSSILKAAVDSLITPEINFNGSTGSRLLKGNTAFAESLEKEIAAFHNAEAGLIYNSGYDANLGLFASVPQEGDTIIYDELVHASIHDGMRLSKADRFMFRHNDLDHLGQRLNQAKGTIYIVVESVYSMDGDSAPLKEMVEISRKFNANIIVDEAHSTGLFGPKGAGRVVEVNLEKDVFARIHTFGKALGCHGAIVLGSELLRNYLINFSRSFIYTTSLPIHSLKTIKCSYGLLINSNDTVLKIKLIISLFKSLVNKIDNIELIESNSPIQCLILSGNDRVKSVALKIQNSGFDVRPILSPTVPKGKERLRICLHSFNSEQEVQDLVNSIKGILS